MQVPSAVESAPKLGVCEHAKLALFSRRPRVLPDSYYSDRYEQRLAALGRIQKEVDSLTSTSLYTQLVDGKRLVITSCGNCQSCLKSRATSAHSRFVREFYRDFDRGNNRRYPLTLMFTFAERQTQRQAARSFDLFLKRLRIAIARGTYPALSGEFKYFASSEYGTSGTQREHIHALFYGLSISDLQYYNVPASGIPNFNSDSIHALWKHGYVTIQKSDFNTLHYFMGYANKPKTYTIVDFHSDYREELARRRALRYKAALGLLTYSDKLVLADLEAYLEKHRQYEWTRHSKLIGFSSDLMPLIEAGNGTVYGTTVPSVELKRYALLPEATDSFRALVVSILVERRLEAEQRLRDFYKAHPIGIDNALQPYSPSMFKKLVLT